MEGRRRRRWWTTEAEELKEGIGRKRRRVAAARGKVIDSALRNAVK